MGLDEFTLKKVLGKGSYGIVYRAVRKADGREYAIKEVDIRTMTHRERQDAVNEIRLLSSVRHPNIIGYHEAFFEEADTRLYIVMEMATHGDLLGLIDRTRRNKELLEEDTIWCFLVQLCIGIRVMHSRGILHRDLKSANVFMMDENHVKIGDLGVAKLVKTRDQLAFTQVGTPYYLSPEIWLGRAYDEKSDIWSLGCLLFEMAALEYPFQANNVKNLKQKILRGHMSRQLPTKYSSELATLIKKMLARQPSRRPSVSDILQMPCTSRGVEILRTRMRVDIGGEHGSPISDRHFILANLDTVKVPRNNLRNLSNQLPEPIYDKKLLVLPKVTLSPESNGSLTERSLLSTPSSSPLRSDLQRPTTSPSPVRFPPMCRNRFIKQAESPLVVKYRGLRAAAQALHVPAIGKGRFGKENIPENQCEQKEGKKPMQQLPRFHFQANAVRPKPIVKRLQSSPGLLRKKVQQKQLGVVPLRRQPLNRAPPRFLKPNPPPAHVPGFQMRERRRPVSYAFNPPIPSRQFR